MASYGKLVVPHSRLVGVRSRNRVARRGCRDREALRVAVAGTGQQPAIDHTGNIHRNPGNSAISTASLAGSVSDTSTRRARRRRGWRGAFSASSRAAARIARANQAYSRSCCP